MNKGKLLEFQQWLEVWKPGTWTGYTDNNQFILLCKEYKSMFIYNLPIIKVIPTATATHKYYAPHFNEIV